MMSQLITITELIIRALPALSVKQEAYRVKKLL